MKMIKINMKSLLLVQNLKCEATDGSVFKNHKIISVPTVYHH